MSKKHYATRDFRDAGTERHFAAGEHVDVSASVLTNYRAAGLVSTDGPQDAEPAADAAPAEPAAQAKPKRARRSTKATS
ncbi:hypothetical protein [Sphingomonas sp. BK235]|uniref:hypothetical protein n=1 Tax=Sphingomonas sp. BK235 TaxID=2512131 RepID=UPI00104B393C|nr:hypothetical protein [Sphingomonas sp. BK235]TCP36549.1 hypothetical protein EV292_10145 [Sphingomonas sp. BK235]